MKYSARQTASIALTATILITQPAVVALANENKVPVIEKSTTYSDTISEEPSLLLLEPVDKMVVYTQANASNDSRTGNGSRSNPYNRFEDAIASVADGGTIIIKDGGNAFLNTQDELGQVPFIIDKNITIRSENSNIQADLIVRAAGIVLEGDVTFKNIRFSVANKVHDSIIANGYALELIDCSRQRGSREVDLFAGSLYDTNGKLIEGAVYDRSGNKKLRMPSQGDHASITIKSTDKSVVTEFGKIFAGSTNGTYAGEVNIHIENKESKGALKLGSVYSCGAKETIPGDMFDMIEPAPPVENPDDYTVAGAVNVTVVNHKADIYGLGAKKAHVSYTAFYPIENVILENIDRLTITDGKVSPNKLTWKDAVGGTIAIQPKGELVLSKLPSLKVNDFVGGGKITLAKEGQLVIGGKIAGITTFQTEGGNLNGEHSGVVEMNHPYIVSTKNVGNEQSFQFNAYPSQTGCFLNKVGNKWLVQKSDLVGEMPDTIDNVRFAEPLTVWNTDSDYVEMEFVLNPTLKDWRAVYNLVYDIYINGELMDVRVDEDGYYSWFSKKHNLLFTVGADTREIPGMFDEKGNPVIENWYFMIPEPINYAEPVAAGLYEIEMRLPMYGLKTNATLQVTNDTVTNDPTIKDSQIALEISSNDVAVSEMVPATYSNTLALNVTIKEKQADIVSAAFMNDIDIVVNGHIVSTKERVSETTHFEMPITKENHFKVGRNEIKVLYGGSTNLAGSTTTTTLTVEKMTPSITLKDVECVYSGDEIEADVTFTHPENMAPTIYYYTNDPLHKTIVAPTNVGVYNVEAHYEESKYAHAVVKTGATVTITKATPSIGLLADVKEDVSSSLKALSVWADMSYPNGGSIPNGKIEFVCSNGSKELRQTVNLSFGSASCVFEGLSVGRYTVTASYIPTRDGYTDVNYGPVSDVQKEFDIKEKPSITIESFTDAVNSWAKDDIQFVLEKNLFKGISNTLFGVNEKMTRGMIVTVLHRMAGEPSVTITHNPFKDVKSNAYYAESVAWASEANIVSGLSKDQFGPNAHVTREQLAAFLYRYTSQFNSKPNSPTEKVTTFKDDAQISDWAKEAMYWAVDQGLLRGDHHQKLNPKQSATRAEVAAIIHRYCTNVR